MFAIRNKETQVLFELPLTGVWVTKDIDEAYEMKRWIYEYYSKASGKSIAECKEAIEVIEHEKNK